jgi:hypothetical protein
VTAAGVAGVVEIVVCHCVRQAEPTGRPRLEGQEKAAPLCSEWEFAPRLAQLIKVPKPWLDVHSLTCVCLLNTSGHCWSKCGFAGDCRTRETGRDPGWSGRGPAACATAVALGEAEIPSHRADCW